MKLTAEQVDELDAMWTAICSKEAAPTGPGTTILLRRVLDSIPALIETARAAQPSETDQ